MKKLNPFTDRSTSLLKAIPLPWVAAGVLALVLSAVLLAGNNRPTADPEPLDPTRAVRVAEVLNQAEVRRLRLSGVTRAVERGELAFLHGGQLAERKVRRGQQVAAGEVLAILHNPALMPGVSAAEARVRELDQQLDQLEREARRLTDLHQRNLVPTEELERIQSRRNGARESRTQAEAQLEEAREQLAEAYLRAPYSATVVDLFVEPGQFVAAGQPVLTLSGNGQLEVEMHLPAARAGGLEPGDVVQIRDIDQGISTRATIEEIGLAGPGRPASVIARLVDADSRDWQPGQPVQIELQWTGPAKVLVPLAAIANPGTGSSHVFKVVEGRAIQVWVDVGRMDGDRVAVHGPSAADQTPLAAGDLVVIAGHGQLLDNENVRVLP